MRICLVSSSFYPATFYGGPISATWGLSKKLAEKDVQMYISTTNANGSARLDFKRNIFIKQQKNLFVKYYHEQVVNRLSFAFAYGVWSDIKSADLVYIQYIFHYTSIISLIYSIMSNKKVILCARGSLSSYGLDYKKKWIKKFWLALFIKPFIRHLKWQASSLLEYNDIKRVFPSADVDIIHDGVDFASFQYFKSYQKSILLKKYTGISFQEVSNLFFSMGRLHVIKGFDQLIDAFALFVKDDKNAKLIIAGGDDGEEEKLKQQIELLKVQDSVFLIGSVDFGDKSILLNNCDYFTLASEFESFGVVIAEALACGKPIVLSNKTPWDGLEKNKCGILVENNVIDLLKGFKRIIKETYDSKRIKDYVRLSFDWGIIADRFIENIKSK